MAEYVGGTAMVLSWVWSGGTATLNADYRTLKFNQEIDVIDGTAGQDANKVKYMGLKDGSVEVSLVQQAGGTAFNAAVAAGNIGTLTIGPEGTAVGKPKITFPSFSSGPSYDWPYNDVAVCTVTFNANAAYTISSY